MSACQKHDLEEAPAKTEKPVKKSDVVTGEELLLKPLIELPMLLAPLLPKSGLAVLAGSSDSGKSSLLRQLSIEIVLKKEEAFGMKLNCTYHSVIFASSEDDENAIAFLLNKQNVTGAKATDFRALRYIFDSGNLLQTLAKELSREKADLIVLDTLTDFYTSSDFNNVAAVRSFFKGYQQLAAKHGCLIIFNHHLSKSKEHTMPSKNALLGSMGVESKARVVLELRKDRFDKNLRHLIPLKGNYLNEEQKSKSLVLKFDENMLFTNTGQMIDIEELAGSRTTNISDEIKECAVKLHEDGKSYRDIAKEIEKEFNTTIGKTTIGNWCKSKQGKKISTKNIDTSQTDTDDEQILIID